MATMENITCYLVLLVLFVCTCNHVYGQRSCPGQCVVLRNCASLYEITQKPAITDKDRKTLLNAQCGNEGTAPKVCCPDVQQQLSDNCQTPDNIAGECIELKKCDYLYDILKKRPISPANIEFLKKSQCGIIGRMPKVCCAQNRQPTISTTESSKVNIPEIETGDGITPTSPLLPSFEECGTQGTGDRVLGGEKTALDEFPWMVLLRYQQAGGSKRFSCGGVLISKRYVLTAAHCVKGEVLTAVGKLVEIRVGEYDTSKETDCVVNQGCNNGSTVDVPVAETIAHEGWNQKDDSQLNDIALVRLAREVEFNGFVKPICLPNKGRKLDSDEKMWVAGWGRTETNFNSDVKLKLQVPILPLESCQKPYQKIVKSIRLNDNLQFCAGGEAGKDSCRGDSGGPAMSLLIDEDTGKFTWLSTGVVSFGPDPCGQPGVPGVYTKVSSHINWILSKLKP